MRILQTRVTQISSGSYTGNGSANRSIPHGLGVIPKVVLIARETGLYQYRIMKEQASIWCWNATINTSKAVTAMDAVNFYVGNSLDYNQSANYANCTYRWIAIG